MLILTPQSKQLNLEASQQMHAFPTHPWKSFLYVFLQLAILDDQISLATSRRLSWNTWSPAAQGPSQVNIAHFLDES